MHLCIAVPFMMPLTSSSLYIIVSHSYTMNLGESLLSIFLHVQVSSLTGLPFVTAPNKARGLIQYENTKLHINRSVP
jgi:hypothetical protein